MRTLLRLLWIAGFCGLTGCQVTQTLTQPTLEIRTAGGRELGVATEYGVLFLGHTAQSGRIDITAQFGDGPSIERAVIEPIGGGIYTAETEIRLPSVPLAFDEPRDGAPVLLMGRDGEDIWTRESRVVRDPDVLGILLPVVGRLRGREHQIGAGVYLCDGGNCNRKRLLGLVSGRIVLVRDGDEEEFLTVVGPGDFWRLVTSRRDWNRRRDWVYREDIL